MRWDLKSRLYTNFRSYIMERAYFLLLQNTTRMIPVKQILRYVTVFDVKKRKVFFYKRYKAKMQLSSSKDRKYSNLRTILSDTSMTISLAYQLYNYNGQ